MENPYDISDSMAEEVIYRGVVSTHSGNIEVLQLCEDLTRHYGNMIEYKSDYVKIHINGIGQTFLTLKVSKLIFWHEWVPVVECSQWFKWTTPEMRRGVVEHLKHLMTHEKEVHDLEEEIKTCNDKLEKYKKESENTLAQARALRQWR